MARRRKVPITKGKKRIVGYGDAMQIKQTLFCGECGRRLKTSITQKPHTSVAMVCDNMGEHKNGNKYLWPLPNVIVPIFEV